MCVEGAVPYLRMPIAISRSGREREGGYLTMVSMGAMSISHKHIRPRKTTDIILNDFE